MERVTLTTLLHLTDTAVSDVCSMYGNVKRDAWMGDACLRMEFSRRLFALVPGAPIGELSQRGARLDQNVTMATFLLTATDLASRHLLQASSRSDHTLGTVFEALYQRAGIEGRRAFVDAYMSFADQRLDSRLAVDRVETRYASTDDTGSQETQQVAVWRWLQPAPILTGRATKVAQSDIRQVLVGMATVQHHAIVRMQSAVRSSRQRREMARTLQHAAVQAQGAASQAHNRRLCRLKCKPTLWVTPRFWRERDTIGEEMSLRQRTSQCRGIGVTSRGMVGSATDAALWPSNAR